MIYDIVIVGAGAAGLFTSINLPKKISKVILEKNKEPGIKVLLSGGERANVSNIDIEPLRDYFGQNKKALLGIFSKYNQWDIQSFFASEGLSIVEEDRGRLILESGDSKELLDLLLRKSKQNNTSLKLNSEVENIKSIPSPLYSEVLPLKKEEIKEKLFEITLVSGDKYIAKNIIVASGGKSFFQVGTTGDSFNFAKDFGLEVISPYRGLCGLVTKKDFSLLSGSSLKINLKILDKDNLIYEETGPFLFTHYGISGPIVFNASVAIGEYLNTKKILSEDDKITYLKDNIVGEISFNAEDSTKKINKFFEEELSLEEKITFGFQDWRSWKEAKITGGGVDINELDNNMQVKKVPGLYFIGESVDITGKTGGFNLQWAWSSAFVCANNIK